MRGRTAVTLRPQWAGCILYAGKRVENRDWRPMPEELGEGGWLVIHAGKHPGGRPGPSGLADAREDVAKMLNWVRSHRDYAAAARADLSFDRLVQHAGCIVAAVRVLDVDRQMLTPWDAENADHWRLRSVHVLPEPIPFNGRQRLWTLPREVAQEVRHQLTFVEALP